MIRNLIVLPDGSELFSGGAGAAIMDCALTRTVNSGEELTLGSVCSAMLEFTVIHPSAVDMTAGQEVTLWHVAEDGSRQKAGVFILEKPVRSGADRCRVTAYDRVSRLDRDLTQWVRGLGEVTLQELAELVCEQCAVTLDSEEIPNGHLAVPLITGGEITGRQLMKWIGEAAGCFCRANADGELELAWYTPCHVALGPGASEEAEIWVDTGNMTVQSRSVRTVDDNRGNVELSSAVLSMTHDGEGNAELAGIEQPLQIPWFQGSLELGDYRVTPVEAVQLRLGDGQESVLWPEASNGANAYILSGNPILSRTTEDVRAALQTVLARLAAVGGYTPCRVNVPATEAILPGHIVTLTDTQGRRYALPVMSVKRTGQRDALECTGESRRDSSAVSNYKTLDQIAQEKVDAQTQADIFRKLTDGGRLEGIYMKDGNLYINASYLASGVLDAELIKAGVLRSNDGEAFFLDLDKGVLKARFDELSVSGKSVTQIAQEAVNVGGANMLKSSGFSYIPPWWGANDTSLAVQTVDSKQCMRIDGTTTDEGVGRALAVQSIGGITPGSYIFTGSVYAEGATILTVGLWDAGFGGIAEESIPVNAGWNNVQVSLSVDRENQAQFGIGISRGSIAYVHHPKLERGNVATDYSPAAGEATQEQVFASLTNNGTVQGFYIQDGKLYINAEFVKIVNLIAEQLSSIKDNSELRIDGAKIRMLSSGYETMLLNNAFDGLPILYMNDVENGNVTSRGELSPHHIKLGGPGVGAAVVLGGTGENSTEPYMILGEYGVMRKLSWKSNGDGTYTLIGK